jgi:hypothetical protein
MRAMGSSRIALVVDDESQRRRVAEHIGGSGRIHELSGGDELVKLAAARALDVVVAGVLHRNDPFISSALRELGRTAPEIALVGLFEPSRPSLDEAADLARELPRMGFVCRPGPRFEYLIRPRTSRHAATFTSLLVGCMDRLPLYGAAKDFALLQALHPSFAMGIPEQARELGVSRRNLERWFQGPDICSAGCFQSVCAAAEAAFLKLTSGMSEREIAAVVEVLSRDGIANPMGVSRSIRRSLRLGLEELRAGGSGAVVEAVTATLRTSRDPSRIPAQWEPDSRYAPEPGVLPVPVQDRITLMDPIRGVEQPLDQFGMDAWPLLQQGMPFSQLTLVLASNRREPPHLVRSRLIYWLGELLVLRLIRREPASAEAGEA